jgi:anti-sigma B factor antagonist
MSDIEQRDISDGALVVRHARQGDTQLISLCGELDLANCRTAEAELHRAMDAGENEVVVDMRELEFIDSTGIALLVAALHRNGEAGRLRFIPSRSPTVARVLQLTGIEERLPLAELPADDTAEAPGPA